MTIALAELASVIGLVWQGDSAARVKGLASLNDAKAGDLSFIVSKKYSQQLNHSKASAMIMPLGMESDYTGHILYHADPYLAFAQLTPLFKTKPYRYQGVHPTALVAEDVALGDDVSIGPYAVIESGCTLGQGVSIGSHCVVQKDSLIGDFSQLYPQVTIGMQTQIGKRCIFHSSSVIGADGFGFAPSAEGWVKIEQIGRVIIGDDVEVGASSTIDRAALNATVIGNGVKLDNQVHIGHNVEVGDHTVMAAGVNVAGSSKIGQQVSIGGLVGISGHLVIADKVVITGRTMVIKSITQPGVTMSSGTIADDNRTWRKNTLRFMQLDELAKRLSNLEHSVRSHFKEN